MAFKKNYTYTSDAQKASFGGFGLRVLTGSSVAGEFFTSLFVTEDCVVSFTSTPEASDVIGYGGDTTVTSLALSAGMTVYGRITDVVVASGKVIGYLG